MNRAVYPGSFDPITLGHIDIISRLAPLYDELIVLVAKSRDKSYLFSDEERLSLVNESVSKFKNVNAILFDGLTVEYALKVDANVIVRGIRAVADFEYEMAIAHMNKKLQPKLETLIMLSSPETTCISSRMVKEIASFGGSLSGMVPECVGLAIKEKLNQG